MMRVLFLLLFSVLILHPGIGIAKEGDKSTTVSPSLYKKLSKAEKKIEKKAYSEAQQIISKALGSAKKGSYEEAIVLRTSASIYALQENYSKAADNLLKCLAVDALPEKQQQQALLNLGQIYMAMEQYTKAVKVLQPWLQSNPRPDAQISILLANAYAQLKQYRKALPYIKQAIKSAKKPKESWYQLNLAIYFELENYSAAADILQKLIARYPEKKQYWSQLASVYQQLKSYKDAAAILNLAYKKGLTSTEKEIIELVNLYFVIDLPHKAAQLLKAEINSKRIKSNSKNWEMLANAWTQAKEFDHATQAFEKASKLNPKGRLYQQLGRVYVEQEKWALAIKALNKSLQKGNLKRPGNSYLLLGTSYYEQKKLKQARQAFVNARKYQRTNKDARQWLDYISLENTNSAAL
jgi:tetratricopeptide (TPR) repeat protein